MKLSECLPVFRVGSFRAPLFVALLFAVIAGGKVLAADPPGVFPPQPAVPVLSAADELKTIKLPAGYHLELVVGDPVIKEPVVAAFDGNGRMFVAEMRSYMQDIDGKDELTRVSRVSLHWSSKGDGIFDKHTVFADNLLLPRMILPLDHGAVLVNETDSSDIWLYRDTDGDGVADKKELWYAGGPRGGNLEHQPSGLIWAVDNWLYTSVNAFRLRAYGTNVVREPTGANGGQWGANQDNYGKMWFVNAGGEMGPVNFQQPIVYGAFRSKTQFSADYLEVWPAIGLGDVEGGYRRFRPEDKTLNHVTATCGGAIFRGDRLPEELRGDLLYGEPVGRLIRRSKVEVTDGVTKLTNPYQKSEFIRATDPNFRPVNMTTGPDGTVYIVDMYRGIIQEGNWVREGSYLRNPVKQYSLQNNVGHGRIWRLVHDDFKPSAFPTMDSDSAQALVTELAHPNGFWRDTAQKLLILKGDKSVVPALQTMARRHTDHLARLHALWTLEGLDAMDGKLLLEKMQDTHPQIRIAAIRISESLYKKGDKSLAPNVLAMAKDKDASVVIQSMLTAHLLKFPEEKTLISSMTNETATAGPREIALQILAPPPAVASTFSAADKRLIDRGAAIFKELCFACHGADGKGTKMDGAAPGTTMAPPLSRSKTVAGYKDGIISVLLKGLTGPVDNKKYDAIMVPMESNDDQWIAAVASYVRNSFGNNAPVIDASEVAKVRASMKSRIAPWTVEELQAALPQALTNRSQWKLTGSHRPDALKAAVDGNSSTRYDTGVQQKPGMWVEVELPEPAIVSNLLLDSAKSPQDYPRIYKVELSMDGTHWDKPVASGRGMRPVTEISFEPTKTRFIRITQNGVAEGLFWSIHELDIYQPGKVAAGTAQAKSAFE
ncbi:MAG: coagulation factor 5/8 type domain protein [Verrucomicrobiales bacterium]|nr:coagulation factor 5/8 type domain protein [Verrucomicrobiales bacterium]